MSRRWMCTCHAPDATMSSAHHLMCTLNENDEFLTGFARWNPKTFEFEEAEGEEAEECADPTCLFPWDHTAQAHAPDTSPEGDPMGKAASKKKDTTTKAYIQPERVVDARNIVEAALFEIHGSDADQPLIDQAEKMLGIEALLAFEKVSNSQVLENIDCEILEKFAANLHIVGPTDTPPFYDCMCNENTGVWCGMCGVMRANGDKKMPWIPNYDRRVGEMVMFITGQIYACVCKPMHKFACKTCRVQRWSDSSCWTFYNPDHVGSIDVHTPPLAGFGSTSKALVTTTTGTTGVTSWGTTGFSKCRHYGETVKLPDGTEIMCSSQHTRKPEEAKPDFGCYMAGSWQPDWLAYLLNWNDFGLPNMSMPVIKEIVDDLLARARTGAVVEIGCIGGHGRTGSLLALLILNAGLDDPDAAIEYVHKNYCTHAIEGKKQAWYINAFHCWMNGKEEPPVPVEPCTKWKHESLFKKGERCPIECSLEMNDFENWWNDEIKKASEPKKTTVVTKHTPAKSTAPKSKTTTNVKTYHDLRDEVTWDTECPPKADSKGSVPWCSTWRHKVVFCQGGDCDCEYWDTDYRMFITRDFKPLAPKPPTQVADETYHILATYFGLDLVSGEPIASTCLKPGMHESPCVCANFIDAHL